jgi:hypothetical protein
MYVPKSHSPSKRDEPVANAEGASSVPVQRATDDASASTCAVSPSK